MTQTIDQNSPPQNWQAPPPPPPTSSVKRTWKTWHLATIGAVALLVGVAMGGAGGNSDSGLKAEVASTKTKAATDVAAADQRANDAVNVAKAQVEKDAAARTAALDKRSADLDTRAAALSVQEAAKKASTFGDGQHQVGADIIAGTYHTDGGSGCYWEKSTGGDGIDSIIDNDNVSGPVTLTIEPAVKFFKTSRCGTWTKR